MAWNKLKLYLAIYCMSISSEFELSYCDQLRQLGKCDQSSDAYEIVATIVKYKQKIISRRFHLKQLSNNVIRALMNRYKLSG